MKYLLLICSLIATAPCVQAMDISIGNTRLAVPSPTGFAPVTREMKPYYELAERFVPPDNVQLAMFHSDADVAIAAQGGIPESERKFYIQTSKQIINAFVSKAEFKKLKETIKEQNKDTMKRVAAETEKLLKNANKGIAKDYDVDPGLTIKGMVPLDPHAETERSLAYSMKLTVDVNDKDGKPKTMEGIVTATFLHLQGKVLFLYVNSEKAGLEWSRKESQKWADAIIAANPASATVAEREARPARSGFDWSRAGRHAVIGGVIGGFIGLLSVVFKKKKKS